MNQTNRWLYKTQTLTLLLIMFLDGVGMSLVLPLIGDLFSPGTYSLLNHDASAWVNQFYYVASLASFSIAMIFGSSILGQLSDKIGRRRTLGISLIGAFIGYIICSVAVIIKAPMLFISGRIIDGLTAGSVPVAQASLADVDANSNKMTGIGQVMFALTAGYMMGPVIARVAFIHETHEYFIPFLLIALTCLLSLSLLVFITKDAPNQTMNEFNLTDSFKQIGKLLQIKTLRTTLISLFLFQSAWSLFYQYIPKIQLANVLISTQSLSGLMVYVGTAMCFSFCVAVPKLHDKLKPTNLVMISFIIFTLLGFCLTLPINHFALYSLLAVLMAVVYAIGYSASLGFLISVANDDEKGLVLGSIGSICAISATVTAIFGGYLNLVGQTTFFAALVLMSAIASLFFFSSIRKISAGAN